MAKLTSCNLGPQQKEIYKKVKVVDNWKRPNVVYNMVLNFGKYAESTEF